MKHAFVFLCQFLRQRGEVFLAETTDKEGTGEDVHDLTVLVFQRTVQSRSVHFAFLVADNGHGIVEGIDGLDIPADRFLEGFQFAGNGNHARILAGLHQQNIQGFIGLRFFLGELPFLGDFKFHINEVFGIQNVIAGAPLIVYHLLGFLGCLCLNGYDRLELFGDGNVKLFHEFRPSGSPESRALPRSGVRPPPR